LKLNFSFLLLLLLSTAALAQVAKVEEEEEQDSVVLRPKKPDSLRENFIRDRFALAPI